MYIYSKPGSLQTQNELQIKGLTIITSEKDEERVLNV